MSEKILFVDDDPALLAACRRLLGGRFDLDTAQSGEAGLAKLMEDGPFGVVVADQQMPEMDGVEFLAVVKQRAPDTIRIMLSGNADLQAAIRAVNEGSIFRFLTKPCQPASLARALEDALAQRRLGLAEKELLQKALSERPKQLTDSLS
jgi:DNA-binding NtrC family response regulator